MSACAKSEIVQFSVELDEQFIDGYVSNVERLTKIINTNNLNQNDKDALNREMEQLNEEFFNRSGIPSWLKNLNDCFKKAKQQVDYSNPHLLNYLEDAKSEVFVKDFWQSYYKLKATISDSQVLNRFLEKFGFFYKRYTVLCCQSGVSAKFFTTLGINVKGLEFLVVYKEPVPLDSMLVNMGLASRDTNDKFMNALETARSSLKTFIEPNYTCLTKDFKTQKSCSNIDEVKQFLEKHKDIKIRIGKLVPKSEFEQYDKINGEVLYLAKDIVDEIVKSYGDETFEKTNDIIMESENTILGLTTENVGKGLGLAGGVIAGGMAGFEAAKHLTVAKSRGNIVVVILCVVCCAVVGGVIGSAGGAAVGEHFKKEYCQLQISISKKENCSPIDLNTPQIVTNR
ncbi:hypothetical protein ABK040_016022 [Willaertia magna]